METVQQVNFMQQLKQPALDVQAFSGLPAGMILAQAALESAWGTSELATRSKNLFGIKYFDNDGNAETNPFYTRALYPTREFQNGEWVTVEAYFRSYLTWEASLLDYARFIFDNPRYVPALQVRNSPTAYIRELAKCGYATAPNYADDVIQVYLFSGINFAGLCEYNPATFMNAFKKDLPVTA